MSYPNIVIPYSYLPVYDGVSYCSYAPQPSYDSEEELGNIGNPNELSRLSYEEFLREEQFRMENLEGSPAYKGNEFIRHPLPIPLPPTLPPRDYIPVDYPAPQVQPFVYSVNPPVASFPHPTFVTEFFQAHVSFSPESSFQTEIGEDPSSYYFKIPKNSIYLQKVLTISDKALGISIPTYKVTLRAKRPAESLSKEPNPQALQTVSSPSPKQVSVPPVQRVVSAQEKVDDRLNKPSGSKIDLKRVKKWTNSTDGIYKKYKQDLNASK